MRARKNAYYRKNPLSTTELVVGGLVVAAVTGIGGYILYQHFNPPAASTALPAVNASNPGVLPTAPYDPSNPATYGGPGTPSTAIPPST